MRSMGFLESLTLFHATYHTHNLPLCGRRGGSGQKQVDQYKSCPHYGEWGAPVFLITADVNGGGGGGAGYIPGTVCVSLPYLIASSSHQPYEEGILLCSSAISNNSSKVTPPITVRVTLQFRSARFWRPFS